MASNLLDDTLEGVFQAVLDPAPDELLIVNPSVDTIETLVAVANSVPELPRIRLLGDESVLKPVRSNFMLASTLANLIEDDTLAIRALPAHHDHNARKNSLLVLPTEVVALVTAGDTVAGLLTDDAEFVSAANAVYMSAWDEAADFPLRTPAFSRMQMTLASEFGESVEADFTGVLDSLATARGDDDDTGLDTVEISLLVAAKHEVQLYDISNWGEDVGLASRATISRTKTRLENRGLLATEKVPVDVGRPRMRLQFADDRLADASTEQLASVAQTLLS
jgi:predicted transcriptional regulator